jgi:hypothetical protein
VKSSTKIASRRSPSKLSADGLRKKRSDHLASRGTWRTPGAPSTTDHREEREDEDLAELVGVAALWGVRLVVRLRGVDPELPFVPNPPACAHEESEVPALRLVVDDAGVAALGALVAELPFAGVVVPAVDPPVDVAMLLP